MREQVVAARHRQDQRFYASKTQFNAQMSSQEIRKFCQLDKNCQLLLKSTMEDLGLSARAHDKILRVARTIADMEGSDSIQIHNLQEAVNYRLLDRDLWR